MASGDLLAVWEPDENEPPSSSGATRDMVNGQPILDFAAGAVEVAIFSTVMPPGFSNGNWTITLHLSMTTATSGDVDWDAAVDAQASGADVTADSFDTVDSDIDNTVPGTAGQMFLVSWTIERANQDAVVANNKFRVRIRRDGATDTASGDAELHKVVIVEA